MSLETLAYGGVDDILTAVHFTPEPSEADWAQMMEFYLAQTSVVALIVFTFGATVNASQRKDMSDMSDKYGNKLILLTNSRLTRGMLTALSWLGVQVRAFAPDDVDGALAYVDRLALKDALLAEVQDALDEARRRPSNAG